MSEKNRRPPPPRPRLKKESLRRLGATEIDVARGGMCSDMRTDVGDVSRYCQD
jgi:hypothetical protein